MQKILPQLVPLGPLCVGAMQSASSDVYDNLECMDNTFLDRCVSGGETVGLTRCIASQMYP